MLSAHLMTLLIVVHHFPIQKIEEHQFNDPDGLLRGSHFTTLDLNNDGIDDLLTTGFYNNVTVVLGTYVLNVIEISL